MLSFVFIACSIIRNPILSHETNWQSLPLTEKTICSKIVNQKSESFYSTGKWNNITNFPRMTISAHLSAVTFSVSAMKGITMAFAIFVRSSSLAGAWGRA